MEPSADPLLIGKVRWPGNPSTKKNRPMVLNTVLDGDGKGRQLRKWLESLEVMAAEERDVFFRLLGEVDQLVRDGQLQTVEERLRLLLPHRTSNTKLMIALSTALGEGGLKTHVLPNEEYRHVSKVIVPQLRLAWQRSKGRAFGSAEEPLHIVASIYLGPRQRPDELSLLEAASDLLQEAGVITDDKWIESWDGSRRYKDERDDPRTEIEVRHYSPTAVVSPKTSRKEELQPCLWT